MSQFIILRRKEYFHPQNFSFIPTIFWSLYIIKIINSDEGKSQLQAYYGTKMCKVKQLKLVEETVDSYPSSHQINEDVLNVNREL